ncbi:MAG: hypothetical protein J6Q59_08420 [Paludibacteraceae bacterium]|nr:hypothetical protein [Paludibacteraceae bacterium]
MLLKLSVDEEVSSLSQTLTRTPQTFSIAFVFASSKALAQACFIEMSDSFDTREYSPVTVMVSVSFAKRQKEKIPKNNSKTYLIYTKLELKGTQCFSVSQGCF